MSKLTTALRKTGLLNIAHKLHFQWHRWRHRGRNNRFRGQHPSFTLPPDYMLYESYRLDYEHYYSDGRNTAEWVKSMLGKYISTEGIHLLEWGCGPARIIRHLPAILPGSRIFGTDYNADTIAWCERNIQGVVFSRNGLLPPLHYADSHFDAVYAISVFTHLSKENHDAWLEEIYRVLRPSGIFLFTTQGEAFQVKLSGEERQVFSEGEIVVRSYFNEGHRLFSSFQPEQFIKSLLKDNWELLYHEQGKVEGDSPAQDVWVIRKQ